MPADSRPTKLRLLAAAEKMFAEHGFGGVSLRAIAAEAGAKLALIHYHFGGKDDLYRAVWAARYSMPMHVRREALANFDYGRPRAVMVRELVEVFLIPLASITLSDDGGRHFARIAARETTDPQEGERGVLAEHLDPIARDLIAALQRVMPELSSAELAWGYQCMIAPSILHVTDHSRTTRLSDGAARSGDFAAALPTMIEFIVGGWLRLCETKDGP